MTSIAMGVGKLASQEITFVRKFRFLIAGQHLDCHWTKKAHIDWTNKFIALETYEVYEDGKIPVLDWVEAIENKTYPDEKLALTTFDGIGRKLYCYEFEGLVIVQRTNNFDMANSDEVTQMINMAFTKATRVPVDGEALAGWHETGKQPLEINHLNGKCTVLQ